MFFSLSYSLASRSWFNFTIQCSECRILSYDFQKQFCQKAWCPSQSIHACQRIFVPVVAEPPRKNGRVFSMFPLPALWSISLTLLYIHCGSQGPCLAPRMLFFFITQHGIDTTSLLLLSTSFPFRDILKHLPHEHQTMPASQKKLQSNIAVWRCFAKLEDLCRIHVSDEILRFLAELIDLLRLLEVLKEGFFVRVVLELLDQLFDFVFTMCILLFNCKKRYTRNSLIHGVAPGFPGQFSSAWLVTRCSCVLILLILLANFASSILIIQPAVLSESSVPFGTALPLSSCIPLYLCKHSW